MNSHRTTNSPLASEPAVTVGTVSALVAAVLVLLVALGVPISDDIQTAILAVIAAAGPLVAAVVTRGLVWSRTSHEQDKRQAVAKQKLDSPGTGGPADV